MESKEFKKIFDEIAQANDFEKKFSGWFKESNECISVLDLQKSNFGNFYDLNIKIYIQGIFGKIYIKNKDLVKKDTGDVFRRLPKEFKDVLDLTSLMSKSERKEKIKHLFDNFIKVFINKAITRSGIIELEKEESIYLLPAVKKELS